MINKRKYAARADKRQINIQAEMLDFIVIDPYQSDYLTT